MLLLAVALGAGAPCLKSEEVRKRVREAARYGHAARDSAVSAIAQTRVCRTEKTVFEYLADFRAAGGDLDPPRAVAAPVPLNRADWTTPATLPVLVRAVEHHGAIALAMTVNGTGGIESCAGNGGDADLGRAACDALRPVARFAPPRDAAGQPTTGTFATEVAWTGFAPFPPAAPDSAPVPLSPMYGWISSDDYPPSSLRAGEQGRTVYRLLVGPDGRTARCTIVGSSGSAALDGRTCALMLRRGRFAPAKTVKGEPTIAETTGAVRWVLPE